MSEIHIKCRHPNHYAYQYEGQKKIIQRHDVPAGHISWDVDFMDYDPITFEAPHIATAPYADPNITIKSFKPNFNSLDDKIERRSHDGPYRVKGGLPRNPRGRTGLQGRGVLGRYGPNHAADPIVTRWKRDSDGLIVTDEVSRRPILQFVSIQRRDTEEWAIPGGTLLLCLNYFLMQFSLRRHG
jgi:ADP-ribose pyrophosphatase